MGINFKLIIAILVVMITVLSSLSTYTYSTPFEVDVTATVYKVIDGDTFDAFPVGRVRLADINAPESGEPGYYEAKNALANLVLNKKVYLDVDDIYVKDKYNRIICVVYVRENEDYLLNVNKWLVDNGYVVITDYPNEFDPYTWSLHVYYPIESETSATTVTTTIIKTTTVATTTVTTMETVTYTTTTITTSITTTTITLTTTYTTTETTPVSYTHLTLPTN